MIRVWLYLNILLTEGMSMAFEQNPRLRQLLDPASLQQMAYERDRSNRNSLFQPPVEQQQFNPLAQRMQQQPMGIQQSYLENQDRDRGILGNLWHGAKNFLFGSGPQQITSTQYLPYQLQGFQDQYNRGSQLLNDPEAGFDEYYRNIMSDYQNNIIPSIANQFTLLGGGALSSPDFAKQLGTGLAAQYAQHRLNFGNQNWNRGLQLAQLGLTPQYQQTYVPREPGVVQQAIPLAGAIYGAKKFGGF